MINESDWKWFGNAGHFCCGRWCRFHLCTQVGNYMISTVGEYVHPRHSKGHEINEDSYLRNNPFGEEIGFGRLFETMVFRAGEPCSNAECGCGLPSIDGCELDTAGCNTRMEARENHMAFCYRAANGERFEEVYQS